MRQKTTEEAIELSKANIAFAERDTHKSHLGPGGYAAKVDKWNKEREDAIAKGLPDPYEGVNEQTFHWCKAREVKVAGGGKDFPKTETKEVVSRIMSLAKEHKASKFVSDREKDFLTVAIGKKEHGGQCRGISSKLNWKEGFAEDRYKYKKHDRFKQEMREIAEQVFKERFFDFVKNTPGLAIPGLASSPGLDSSPCLVLPLIPSNDQCAVNSVTSPTPCELHIPLGIHGRTEEVARALVILGSGLFHGTPIPPDYARFQVLSVEPKHEGETLDIPTPEGIHFLGQSVDQFILWHKKYIMNLAPQEQLQLKQGHVVLKHGPIGDAMEEEHVVPERDHADSDPPIHEFMPTPPDLAEKPATSLEVIEKLATPSKVIEKPAPSKQPPEAKKPAAAQTCDTSVVPKMVRAYEKAATPEVQTWFKKVAEGNEKEKQKGKEPAKEKRATKEIDLIPDKKIYKSVLGLDQIADMPDCPLRYEHGKPFLTDWALEDKRFLGEMRKIHDWYLRACRLGVHFVSAHIPGECFTTLTKTTIADFLEFQNMFRLGQMDITAMTLWCV
ncbi:hypothetical protein BS78_K222000 [Paspalum vaginatum]|uniref:DUF8039 domain-containing protein n=1 Tax=Paspalum vaginatum TaxID=158149 RepID=A0A9W8CGP8_9POAL|nr:hypothetical protein BS78_K222000 [Paspalum vaginatum]